MKKKTIHFVYAFGPNKSCPNAIGNELTIRLSENYLVVQHQWDSQDIITPQRGDILLGHPHHNPKTVFRISVRDRRWARKIMICPFSHGDYSFSAFQDSVIRDCDLYMAITGSYWFDSIDKSLYVDWMPKMRHLDLAVNKADFPWIKLQFNPPGKRKLIYIGHLGKYKNTRYLSEIAIANPEIDFFWAGPGDSSGIPGVFAYGYVDFQSESGRALIKNHDFLVTVGNSDSNPTTILEAMSWGIIPICTPQSGYLNNPGMINIPLNNVDEASKIIKWANEIHEGELIKMQLINSRMIDEHFNWDRFADDVMRELQSTEAPMIKSHPIRRLFLRYYASVSLDDDSTFLVRAIRFLRSYRYLYMIIRALHRKIRSLVDSKVRH